MTASCARTIIRDMLGFGCQLGERRFRLLKAETIRRELRGIALALLMVAATTVVAYVLVQTLEIRRGSVIYLLPVLLAGWHLGLIPALVAAVAGVLWSGYLFFSPFYSFYVARPNEILNLLLFMVVAVVTSHLANSMKRQTEIARRRENEMSDLYAFSRRLGAARSAEEIYARDRVSPRQPGPPQGGAVRRPAQPRSRQAAGREVSAGPRAYRGRGHSGWQHARHHGRRSTPAISGWCAAFRRTMPDFGVIAIDLGSVPAAAVAEVRQRVDDLLSDAAATLERLDVARAINDAKMRSEAELLREALIGSSQP